MEVQLDKRWPVPVQRQHAWHVLADIRSVAACMPGAQITEQLDDTHYKGTVRSRVGPATMTFNGDIEVLGLDVDAQQLRMLGKGSDRGGSSASMELTARIEPGSHPGECALVGQAAVIVNGKLAQFGSRLIMPVADAMLAQFAANFVAAATAVQQAAPTETAVPALAEPDPATATMPPPPPVKDLNALGLMWMVFKGWLSGLFRSTQANKRA